MGITGIGRGCRGDLVARLQAGLAARRCDPGTVDGVFGSGTERAVSTLQARVGVAPSGCADPATWQHATGTPWPSLFERCLQLTARLEGHGYEMVAGNFDGAGLTWGIIGFTLRSGGIQALLRDAAARDPALLRNAFDAAADELAARLATDAWPALAAWATRISVGPARLDVAEPWRAGFRRLGAMPLMQELQRERARRVYFDPAQALASALALDGDLGIALAFDVQVQMGGVKPAVRRDFAVRATRIAAADARSRRVLLAELVAASALPRWRADVATRKQAIATGTGVVHGVQLDLAAWGLDPGSPP